MTVERGKHESTDIIFLYALKIKKDGNLNGLIFCSYYLKFTNQYQNIVLLLKYSIHMSFYFEMSLAEL